MGYKTNVFQKFVLWNMNAHEALKEELWPSLSPLWSFKSM